MRQITAAAFVVVDRIQVVAKEEICLTRELFSGGKTHKKGNVTLGRTKIAGNPVNSSSYGTNSDQTERNRCQTFSSAKGTCCVVEIVSVGR